MAKDILKVNRGDTFSFTVLVEDLSSKNEFYTLKNTDILYFALMPPHGKFEEAEQNGGIIRYFLAEDQNEFGTFDIKLNSADTRDLFLGVYYYSLKLQKLDIDENEFRNNLEDYVGNFNLGEIQTVVKRTKFIINE